MASELRRAVFLDRDGTINEEKEYLWRIEEFCFINGSVEAIRVLNGAGFLVVVVTNQSGIGRGYFTEADLERLHLFMEKELAREGAIIDASYFCPHHPQDAEGEYLLDCSCRKPLPGMLLNAARDLGIDLAASWMVGDKRADIDAGVAAGCRSVLVRTGYGSSESASITSGVPVVDDLLAAVGLILSQADQTGSSVKAGIKLGEVFGHAD
jgi:D-glycero-D-manno-heptose 1,7-bisphosphate phosphatase